MATMTLADLSKKMSDIDFCMLTTRTVGDRFASRPMSNNGEVDYDGDSYFFTYDSSRTVLDITVDPNVGLTFQGSKSLLGKPGIFIAIAGTASFTQERHQLEKHWTKDLEIWFADGIDTPGIALIQVSAERIHYWDGEDEGDVAI